MGSRKQVPPEPKPAKFTPGEIIAAAQVFGTKPEIMAGALHGITGKLTKDQAKEKLESYLARPIKKSNKGV